MDFPIPFLTVIRPEPFNLTCMIRSTSLTYYNVMSSLALNLDGKLPLPACVCVSGA